MCYCCYPLLPTNLAHIIVIEVIDHHKEEEFNKSNEHALNIILKKKLWFFVAVIFIY